MGRELLVRTAEGVNRSLLLNGTRISLGRASTNDLCYQEDTGLSRQHLAFENDGEEWRLIDLGSRNGTFVNGDRVAGSRRLSPGDRIAAGHLLVTYDSPARLSAATVVFDSLAERIEPVAGTVVAADLSQLLAKERTGSQADSSPAFENDARVRALVNAGRELAGHRPLADLFPLILDLAMDAVKAERGVLLTLERGELVMRAAHGQDFHISRAVRDRVVKGKESLLVQDALSEDDLRGRMSIVEQSVRSILAVPLQTDDSVIGLIYLDTPDFTRGFSVADLNLLTVMANVAAIRIEHARLAEIEQAEKIMARDLSQAGEIQQGLLPSIAPRVAGLDIAAHNAACRTVGGDYYDFFPYADGRIGIVVADVAGKGMPAALLMSSLQARFQVLADDPSDLAGLMFRLNRLLVANCPSNRFVTLFFGVLDPAAGTVAYCNAGHNPPLIVRAGGEVSQMDQGGPVLGILPAASYQEERCEVASGDIVVLYSDGVTEAMRADDEEFGEQRLIDVVVQHRELSAAQIAEKVKEALAVWMGATPPMDDVTVVIVRST